MTAASPAPVSAADFGTRFSAFVIDATLLFCAQWIIFIVLSRQLQAVGLTSTEPCTPNSVALCEGPNTALWTLLLLLYIATTVGYHALFEGRYGATPGKRWMGLHVADSNGHAPIGLAAGGLRSIVRQLFWLSPLFLFEVSPLSLGLPAILFALVPGLALLVFVIGAFRSDGLAGHDLVARTVVVRNDNPVRPTVASSITNTRSPDAASASGPKARSSHVPVFSPPGGDPIAAEDSEDSA